MNANITDVRVFNSPTQFGTDVSVDSDGFISILNYSKSIRASRRIKLTRTPAVAEQLQVDTITPSTVTASAVYNLSIRYIDKLNGNNEVTVTFTVTSGATTSATLICNDFRTQINNKPNCPIAATGTTTLVLTAETGYANFYTFTSDTKLTIVNTTAGIPQVGKGSQLALMFPSSTYADMANITASASYTQWNLTYDNLDGYGNPTLGNSFETIVILVNEAATYYLDLSGANVGTLAFLKQGYRVTAYAAVGANVDVASNVATRASGSFLTELIGNGAGNQTVLAIAGAAYPVQAAYTTGAAAGVDKAVVVGANVSASAANYIKLAPIPC